MKETDVGNLERIFSDDEPEEEDFGKRGLAWNNSRVGDDGVMKMWIEMVSDFLYVNSNKLSNTHFFLLLHYFNYH